MWPRKIRWIISSRGHSFGAHNQRRSILDKHDSLRRRSASVSLSYCTPIHCPDAPSVVHTRRPWPISCSTSWPFRCACVSPGCPEIFSLILVVHTGQKAGPARQETHDTLIPGTILGRLFVNCNNPVAGCLHILQGTIESCTKIH
jgi:hypothetical protein